MIPAGEEGAARLVCLPLKSAVTRAAVATPPSVPAAAKPKSGLEALWADLDDWLTGIYDLEVALLELLLYLFSASS
jgi:hypothetical protein